MPLNTVERCACGSLWYDVHNYENDVWDREPPACPFCKGPSRQTNYFGHPFFYFTCTACGEYEVGFTKDKWWRDDGVIRAEGRMPDPNPRVIRVWRIDTRSNGDWEHDVVYCATSHTNLSLDVESSL